MGKFFWFCFVWGGIVFIIALWGFFSRRPVEFPLYQTDLWLSLFLAWCVLRTVFAAEGSFSEPAFVQWFLLSVLYLIWKTWIRKSDTAALKACLAVFLGIGLIEASYGLGQLYGLFPSGSLFSVTGHFVNPDHFAGYIASVTPFAFGLFWLQRGEGRLVSKVLYYLGLATFVLCLLVLPGTLIRGAWIAAACGIGFVLLHTHWSWISSTLFSSWFRKSAVAGAILLAAGLGSIVLYQMKPDSVDGRLFIWKMTVETIREAPLFGNGFDSYRTNHNRVQATYFMGVLERNPHHFTDASENVSREVILAGNVEHAHNEYLQLFSELGLVGLVFFGGFLFSVFKNDTRQDPSGGGLRQILSSCAKASLGAILISSLFSFPLHILPTLIHFFFFLALVSALNSSHSVQVLRIPESAIRVGCFIILLGSIGFLMVVQNQHSAYKGWSEAYRLAQMGNLEVSISRYEPVYPMLKSNGKFLFTYGGTLAAAGRYAEAIPLLERSEKTYSNPNLFLALGEAWQGVGDVEKAAESYLYSWYVMPHRMYPLYKLVLAYQEAGRFDEATFWAETILGMEEKVPTRAAQEIKTEMEAFLEGGNRNE